MSRVSPVLYRPGTGKRAARRPEGLKSKGNPPAKGPGKDGGRLARGPGKKEAGAARQ